jgi:DNA-binding ferritin-like protein
MIFAITDEIAERVRKLGGRTLHSIGNIARLQRLADNDADYVEPRDMLAELRSDNQALIASMRAAVLRSVPISPLWPEWLARRICCYKSGLL